eukprot:gnl/MRDRNA2_/MRDRNA2_76776_c0_seq2.p1 gnl/MRDRNA2_/MRDRNA2_76776_c0~~gnl/MRDRNA2_/MRDRNA2_76776_c0_seq2.p1  ORF type:complete len:131 (-),score=2.01 gnl/MRDRNA2_/MRDRNA2_76776_c0_seq2:69-461(-)
MAKLAFQGQSRQIQTWIFMWSYYQPLTSPLAYSSSSRPRNWQGCKLLVLLKPALWILTEKVSGICLALWASRHHDEVCHHLAPTLSSAYYPSASLSLLETAKRFNISYHLVDDLEAMSARRTFLKEFEKP